MAITRERRVVKIVSTRRKDQSIDAEVYYRNVATDDSDGEVFVSEPDLITPERYDTLSTALKNEARTKIEAELAAILALYPAPV